MTAGATCDDERLFKVAERIYTRINVDQRNGAQDAFEGLIHSVVVNSDARKQVIWRVAHDYCHGKWSRLLDSESCPPGIENIVNLFRLLYLSSAEEFVEPRLLSRYDLAVSLSRHQQGVIARCFECGMWLQTWTCSYCGAHDVVQALDAANVELESIVARKGYSKSLQLIDQAVALLEMEN
ncbi:flagellar transcriptional regulator FlhC [Neiella marina]|uniref:Flagellar transcriptional regulator FlhC n=1 Tax=Neiella holothuriorum TaxID=2870530 RepID=A0ABS7EG55_9GAMM|nr:flagellar transcriptional regulator FlhC [Neiella holothuriorum]MBW8191322.1 flagellar transcriptional regulator FlhC [Neiella holothuriorum]